MTEVIVNAFSIFKYLLVHLITSKNSETGGGLFLFWWFDTIVNLIFFQFNYEKKCILIVKFLFSLRNHRSWDFFSDVHVLSKWQILLLSTRYSGLSSVYISHQS